MKPNKDQLLKKHSVKSTLRAPMPHALLTIALGAAASAQTWQTVDDFQYAAGKVAANWGLAVAPSGVLFASGTARDASMVYHGLVMASADSGNTWSSPLDDFVYPGGNGTFYDTGLVSDSTRNLYVAGSAPSTAHLWLVRQGTAAGSSWTTVDDAQFVGSGTGTSPHGIAADAMGNIYAIGAVYYTNGVTAWTVRKGIGGTSFSTVDSYAAGGYAVAQAVVVHPTAGIFVAGHTNYSVTGKNGSSTTYSIWTVRRSTDGGASWTTVDKAIYGQPKGIGLDASGNIYVVGQSVFNSSLDSYNTCWCVEDAPGGSHWIVRMSANGGNSWVTVDDFYPCVTTVSTSPPYRSQTQCPYGAAANAFGADANGNLFVVGCLRQYSSETSEQWVVRENTGGTGAWTTVDTFQYTSNEASAPAAVAADAAGRIFVGGWGQDSSGLPHWLVRRN